MQYTYYTIEIMITIILTQYTIECVRTGNFVSKSIMELRGQMEHLIPYRSFIVADNTRNL